MADTSELLQRIEAALAETKSVFARFDRERVQELTKSGGDPVTAVDLEIDAVLRSTLPIDGEGWLSEESTDSGDRLARDLVWIVDPLDGTREFIDGLPEFCTSVAAVVDGQPVAGGVFNPAAQMMITGAIGAGVRCNGEATSPLRSDSFESMRVLASRSEWARGQWAPVESTGVSVIPMGSVAYKMARVAAGIDHTTWTPVPKHEWDVAGGAALLAANGGRTLSLDGDPITFNRETPWLSGAIAAPPGFERHLDIVHGLIREQLAKD